MDVILLLNEKSKFEILIKREQIVRNSGVLRFMELIILRDNIHYARRWSVYIYSYAEKVYTIFKNKSKIDKNCNYLYN